MAKRKKRLLKQIEGIERQIQQHLWKLQNLKGRKDTTPKYWLKELERKFMARKNNRIFHLVKKKQRQRMRV